MRLKKGDKVTIWEDPITKSVPEGRAELIEFISSNVPGEERWMVLFDDDKESVENTYLRSIYTERDGNYNLD